MLRRSALATFVVTLFASGLIGSAPASASGPAPQLQPTAPLTVSENLDGTRTLDWSLQGTSDRINVLPNLRCELGPAGSSPQFPTTDPCLWLVDHLAPVPAFTPEGCLSSREPDSGGPAPYASWRCDMRVFRDVVIRAAQTADDRSFVMFNTPSTGGSGVCATIPVSVQLGQGSGELQAADNCAQRIDCGVGYSGNVYSDPLDTVHGCTTAQKVPTPGTPNVPSTTPSQPSGNVPEGAKGGGAKTPVASSPSDKKTEGGPACPGASSGRKGNSPLYSVFIKAQGKRGMVIYVHMRRAVPITVDVRMRRSPGRGAKIVRWVSRCAKKGTNVITLPNATGGAKSRRNYRVIVKSPNSTYPLRSGWEALPRR